MDFTTLLSELLLAVEQQEYHIDRGRDELYLEGWSDGARWVLDQLEKELARR